MSNDIITRARELLDAATPGPWKLDFTDPSMDGSNWQIRRRGVPGIRISAHSYGDHGGADAEFIAATPELVSGLLAVVERVEELADLFYDGLKRFPNTRVQLLHHNLRCALEGR
jgi:hypothetical protein